MIDHSKLLIGILSRYSDSDKWSGQPFERIKRLSNTKVGDVGLDFVVALCENFGISVQVPTDKDGKRMRASPWDLQIGDWTFELKTATEDTSGSFQFNHIRYHRAYDALLCIGVSPSDIFMGAWSKAEVATGKAGRLVTMDKGSSATHKLTKRRDQLQPITMFESSLIKLISRPDS